MQQGAPVKPVLYYVHDPMCSWCWGFAPVLKDLLERLPASLRVKKLLGGLAPDTDEPMPENMKTYIQETWRRIEQRILGTEFNFAFWSRCVPRRSTYPACRAVIAARYQGEQHEVAMTEAIQRAYYTQARNPSDETTLIELAGEIGLNTATFAGHLRADATQQRLLHEISLARQLGVDSFPGLVLKNGQSLWCVPVDYTRSAPMIELINDLLAE